MDHYLAVDMIQIVICRYEYKPPFYENTPPYRFMKNGFIDSFRFFNDQPDNYSWWSYRAGSRGKNLGWRIDYNLVAKHLDKHLKSAQILPDAIHSDHCPVLLELQF